MLASQIGSLSSSHGAPVICFAAVSVMMPLVSTWQLGSATWSWTSTRMRATSSLGRWLAQASLTWMKAFISAVRPCADGLVDIHFLKYGRNSFAHMASHDVGPCPSRVQKFWPFCWQHALCMLSAFDGRSGMSAQAPPEPRSYSSCTSRQGLLKSSTACRLKSGNVSSGNIPTMLSQLSMKGTSTCDTEVRSAAGRSKRVRRLSEYWM